MSKNLVEILDGYKVGELKELAKTSGLKGYSKLKKAELVEAVSKQLEQVEVASLDVPDEIKNIFVKEETKEKKSIYVYVCGAVMQAGVYELQQDSRVYEAIQKAGGFAENADISEINQAALLQDEEQIYVPAAGEVDHSLKEEGEAGDAGGKVNLNTATKEELMTLAGIGESKADSIIKYREEHGKFQSIEDIKQIEGIKDGVFQKIKDLITV